MALALGGTVGDLQRRMTPREVLMWQEYRKRHGPLSYERKYDRPAAIITAIMSRLHGGKLEFKDFMPWPAEENEEPATVEEIFAKVAEIARGQNG